MGDGNSPASKVVMLGDSGVGKTSIVLQLSEHAFRRMTTPTVGSGCFFKEITTTKGVSRLNVWDTAGEERYRSFTGLYSQGALAGIVVFDVTDESTFESISNWVQTFRETADPTHLIWVVGNKLDLDSRKVTQATAKAWAVQQGFKYFDVCAKTGENIDLVFLDIAESVLALRQPQRSDAVLEEAPASSGCC
jgi:small GTP-binding protein